MSLRIATLFTVFGLLVVGSLAAAETPAGASTASSADMKLVFKDDLTSSHDEGWHLNHGTWKIVEGAWQGSEEPADKHAAAARYLLKDDFQDGVIEFDVKLDGAKMVSVSINDRQQHVCRLQIMANQMRVNKDDYDRAGGPDKAEVLATEKLTLAPGAWHHVRLSIAGEQMTAQIDGVTASGKHAQIAKPKANFAFVVSGQTASFKNLRVSTSGK
jgi:hypothetical protein